MYGTFGAPLKYREQEIQKARMLIDYYSVIGINEFVEPFCREKIRLEKAGQIIEDFDLLIDITARETNMAVVTHNLKHFNRIENLKVEDWSGS